MIKYFLFVLMWGSPGAPMAIGPFDGLLACERAAAQIIAVSSEAKRTAHTVCLSTKAADFKFKK